MQRAKYAACMHKVKGKVVPVLKHHAMKTYWGGETVPRILDLGTRRRQAVSFMSQVYYTQGKSPWYPLDRRLGGAQSQSGHDGEEKNSQLNPLNPNHLAHSQLLYRLSYTES
jgi:hypothetical protein